MIAHLRDVHRIAAGGKTDSTSKATRSATPYPPRSERRKALMCKLPAGTLDACEQAPI